MTAAAFTFTATPFWYTREAFATLTVTTNGGDVLLLFRQPFQYDVQLERGTTVLRALGGSSTSNDACYMYLDSPAAGTYTYRLTSHSTSTTSGSTVPAGTQIVALELKK